MKCRIGIPCLLALTAVLPGCGKSGAVETIAQAIVDQPNCLSGQDRLWSALYREVDERGQLPDSADVDTEIHGLARTPEQSEALTAAYSAIARQVRFLGREEAMNRLAEMEIGDRTSDEKIARQDEVENSLNKALITSVTALGNCPARPPVVPSAGADSIPLFEGWRTTVAAPLYGAYKTMSVGYQSCNAIGVAPVSVSTAPISGITVTGTHANGVGLTREVTNPADVFRTNPFYAGRKSPPGGCFSATNSPIIYDYGGKPYTTTAAGGAIDLAKNGGSGTDALGVDCSGFIATAVLAGGLRLKLNTTSKAAQSGGVSASMFADPGNNGLTCFSRLESTKTQNLRSGDIIANSGHVIMVDKTGADPFGIAAAKTSADCDKVAAAKFTFTIIQSSPSKSGIGMNRFLAADYLAGSTSMRTGLEAYAKSFCRVRLGLDPVNTLANTSTAVVVRNQGGPACTDSRITLTGESCLQACGAVTASTD